MMMTQSDLRTMIRTLQWRWLIIAYRIHSCIHQAIVYFLFFQKAKLIDRRGNRLNKGIFESLLSYCTRRDCKLALIVLEITAWLHHEEFPACKRMCLHYIVPYFELQERKKQKKLEIDCIMLVSSDSFVLLYVMTYLCYLVRSEFREEAKSVDRNDFRTIEHMLRHGYKQKKLLEMPGFTGSITVVGKSSS